VWVRVVSMPCMELFEEQSAEYQRSVFPVGAPVMSIEPASTNAWKRYAHAPYGTVSLSCLRLSRYL
jgi:transketolase